MPVSLIGTFAGLLMLGYSINTLTLFGMVLAIGIVVDDAIVVLENVERIMREENLNAREASIIAMEEVTSPIIAIVLVLVSVFVPIAFLGGLTGELYRQFAITISIAVIDLGRRRADVDAGAVLVVAESSSTAEPQPFFPRIQRAGSAASPTATRAGVVWMIRRSALGLVLFAGDGDRCGRLWRHHAGLAGARRRPGLLHCCGDPARRRQFAADR